MSDIIKHIVGGRQLASTQGLTLMLKGKVGAAEGKLKKEGDHSRRREEPQQLNSTIPALGWGRRDRADPEQTISCLGGNGGSKVQKTYRVAYSVVNSFDSAFDQIGLVPETGCLVTIGMPREPIRAPLRCHNPFVVPF
jgi:hypothetical protein